MEIFEKPGYADIPGKEIPDKKRQRSIRTARKNAPFKTCFHPLIMPNMRKGTQSGMRRMTNSRKSNQTLGQG